ncbi:MAG: hypothetical protein U1E25_12490 [Methylocystis sp.]
MPVHNAEIAEMLCGRLNELRGFGPKLQENIAAALAKPVAVKRFKLPFAKAEATALIDWLRSGLDGGQLALAGSFRRRRDTVGDLDVLATSADAAAVGDRLTQYANVAQVVAHGPTRTTVILRSGLQVDLRVVEDKSYGAALLYFTGCKTHNIALRNIAVDRGWKLNERGFFSKTRSIAGATEAEICTKLGLQFVLPELHEDRGEIALAQKNALPKLVKLSDVRGDLHVHSNWRVADVLAEMAQAGRRRGCEYMALTDHSLRVTVAHGLNRARVLRQIKEVDRPNAKMDGFTVLKGVEVDILADGELDMPDEVLSRLDVIGAAVHYKFDLPREKADGADSARAV